MNIIKQMKYYDILGKLSATLLMATFITGILTNGVLWLIPICALYLSTSMINSDIRRMKLQLKANYGTGAEEHY